MAPSEDVTISTASHGKGVLKKKKYHETKCCNLTPPSALGMDELGRMGNWTLCNAVPCMSHVEKVEKSFGGVELKEVFLVEGGLAKGQERSDRRTARQKHVGVEAAQNKHTSKRRHAEQKHDETRTPRRAEQIIRIVNECLGINIFRKPRLAIVDRKTITSFVRKPAH